VRDRGRREGRGGEGGGDKRVREWWGNRTKIKEVSEEGGGGGWVEWG